MFSYGDPAGQVSDSTKVWWMQSELLGALAIFHRLTGEQRYADLLAAQTTYIADGQSGPVFGEWYARCARDGAPLDPGRGSSTRQPSTWSRGCIRQIATWRPHAATVEPEVGWLEWAL